MAKRATHVIVGVPAGAAAAAYTARHRPSSEQLVEIVGGGIGGYVGCLLPDYLEPAISSWHRSIAHSWAAVGAGAKTLPELIRRWQDHCRVQAEEHEKLRMQSADDWTRAWHTICALFWRLLSGIIVGLAVGYASHLGLDLGTPRGLPLLI